MQVFTFDQLKSVEPRVLAPNFKRFSPYFERYLTKYAITSKLRLAAFFANVLVESAAFSSIRENMNYSDPERIARIFRGDFDVNKNKVIDPKELEDAKKYMNNPQRLANRVYANQNGNGDEASGDGWKFRGAGLIQVTGRGNVQEAAYSLGLDLINQPNLLDTPEVAVGISCYFFAANGCNALADLGEFKEVVRKINPVLLGLNNRKAYYDKLLRV